MQNEVKKTIDIGEIINFKPLNNQGAERVCIEEILGLPITIIKWNLKKSKFNDSENFVELILKTKDDEILQVNTASEVIKSQLEEISKKYPMGIEFSCVIKKRGKFFKMFPSTQGKLK